MAYPSLSSPVLQLTSFNEIFKPPHCLSASATWAVVTERPSIIYCILHQPGLLQVNALALKLVAGEARDHCSMTSYDSVLNDNECFT